MEDNFTPNIIGRRVFLDFNEFCCSKGSHNPLGLWDKSIVLEYADYLADEIMEMTYDTLLVKSAENLSGEVTLFVNLYDLSHPDQRLMAENFTFRIALQKNFTKKVKERLKYARGMLALADNALLNDFLSDIDTSTKIHRNDKEWIFYLKTNVDIKSHHELVKRCAKATASLYNPYDPHAIEGLRSRCVEAHNQLAEFNDKVASLLSTIATPNFTKTKFDQVVSSFYSAEILFMKMSFVFSHAISSHYRVLCYPDVQSWLIKAREMTKDSRNVVINKIIDDAQQIANDYFASAEKYLGVITAVTDFAANYSVNSRPPPEGSGDELGQLGDEALASAHFIHKSDKSLNYITEAIIDVDMDIPKVKETDRVSVKKYRADFDTKCHDMIDTMEKLKVKLVEKALYTFYSPVFIYNNSLEQYCAVLEELKGKLADNNRTADQRTQYIQQIKDLSEKVLKLSEKIKSTQNNFKAIYDKLSDEAKVKLAATNDSMKNEETETTEKTQRFKTTYTDIKKAHPTKFPRSWADWARSMLGRGTTPINPAPVGGAAAPVHTTTQPLPPPPLPPLPPNFRGRGDGENRGARKGAEGEDRIGPLNDRALEKDEDAVKELHSTQPIDLLEREDDDSEPDAVCHRGDSSDTDDPLDEEEATTAALRASGSSGSSVAASSATAFSSVPRRLRESHGDDRANDKGSGAAKPLTRAEAHYKTQKERNETVAAKTRSVAVSQADRLAAIEKQLSTEYSAIMTRVGVKNPDNTIYFARLQQAANRKLSHDALERETAEISRTISAQNQTDQFARFIQTRAMLLQQVINRIPQESPSALSPTREAADPPFPPPPHATSRYRNGAVIALVN